MTNNSYDWNEINSFLEQFAFHQALHTSMALQVTHAQGVSLIIGKFICVRKLRDYLSVFFMWS